MRLLFNIRKLFEFLYNSIIMNREVISTNDAPSAIGPYSQAILAGQLLFVSGQVGFIPATMKLIDDSVEKQTEQVLHNLRAIVKAAGSSLNKAVKITVYMTDMNDYHTINSVYERFFSVAKPARAAVAVRALPANAKVEIDGIFVV